MPVLQPSHKNIDSNETITHIHNVSISVVFDHAQCYNDRSGDDRHAVDGY